MEKRLHHPEIFTLMGTLQPAECEALIALAEDIGFAAAPITTILGPQHLPRTRNNTRVMVDDPARAAWIWERVAPFVPAEREGWRVQGLNERLRFYRYDPGQRFRWHADGCFQRSSGERSFLTFMIYLNQDFAGGETEFEVGGESDLAIRPRTGSALVFAHPLWHQGAEVVAGRKYALRTDVMYARSA